MFNLILEKCVSLLKEQLEHPSENASSRLIVSEDLQVLLPAVKVWCDWLLCHSAVWNPPPSCVDFRVGPAGDAWSRVATLVNLLEKLEHHKTVLITERREDYDLVRLPEDATLCGFTPLMFNDQEPIYTSKETDMELAQVVLRIRKIVFFGTVFLCGVDPPVLKLQKFEGGESEYISVVQSSIQGSPSSLHEDDQSDSDLVVESFSEEEDEYKESKGEHKSPDSKATDPVAHTEIQSLLHRKEELERRHRKQERHRQRVQEILRDTVVSVEIEVKPHNLVPDTNCFIDYLSQLQTLAKAGPAPEHYYTLMVPLVVLKELEGLARGGKDRDHIPVPAVDPEHAAKVAESAKQALTFLRSQNPGVRCVTTLGTVFRTGSIAMEEDTEQGERNDDKILATSLSLCEATGKDYTKPGEPRRLYREVVLLTEDRNLRVKALARHVPVREVPDFMQWAGLG
ncbi:Telomerase-binding protein EST1A [Blattella germanica]|nr:Telomerase-binding protein EST1A [Blattella germanica]